MIVRSGVIGSVVVLVVVVGCTPMFRQNGLGPYAIRPALPAEGFDSSGRPLRLSDQKGKVVLLSFWHGL